MGIMDEVNPLGPLSDKHLDKLRGSGLNDETIRAAGLRTVEDRGEAAKVLNWRSVPPEMMPALLIPFHDHRGRRVEGFARLRPDGPRTGKAGRVRKYEQPKGAPVRPYFPPGAAAALADACAALLITEGELKALKAHQEGFPCVGLVGVDCWSVRRKKGKDGKPAGPRMLLPELAALPLKGRKVFIVFDSDIGEKRPVQRAELTLAGALQEAGAEVFLARLPAAADGDKVGLDDFLVASGADELRAVLGKAAAAPRAAGRRVVILSTDEPLVVRQVTEALASDGHLFRREGCLFQAVEVPAEDRPRLPVGGRSLNWDRPAGLVVLRPAEAPYVRLRVAERCLLVKPRPGGGLAAQHPTNWLVQGVMAAPGGIPNVRALLPGPTIDQEGRLINNAGLDGATGWYLGRALPGLSLPRQPGIGTAQAAASELLALVADFPFESESDRARWLTMLLTACVRHLVSPTPLGLFVANTAGSGKTLLVKLIATIAHGTPHPILMSWPDGLRMAGATNEVRKRLASLLHEGASLAMVDNLPRGEAFGCPELDAFLTSLAYHDRELGRNDGRRVGGPNGCLLLATGNNVRPSGDTADRTLVVRLRSDDPNPRARDPRGFRLPALEEHVAAERARYLGLALTICRAWVLEGCPQPPGAYWGTFEDFVRGPVAMVRWLGYEDPIGDRAERAGESDEEARALDSLLSLWPGVVGGAPATCSEALARIEASSPLTPISPDQSALREALASLGAGPRWPPSPKRLGEVLSGQCDRIREVDGRKVCLRRTRDSHAKIWRYFVEGPAGSAGSCGVNSSSPTHTHRQQEEHPSQPPPRTDSKSTPHDPADPATPPQDFAELLAELAAVNPGLADSVRATAARLPPGDPEWDDLAETCRRTITANTGGRQ